jgi:esterase
MNEVDGTHMEAPDGTRDVPAPASHITRRESLQMIAAVAASAMVPAWGHAARVASAQVPAPRSRTVRANGLRLHALDWGSESAPPLLTLHAGYLNAHAWDTFAAAMSPTFRVIAPDARGFGDSEWGSAYDTDAFVADLHALITELRLPRIVLCGNSMGGTVAMAYASVYPQMVERLILVDTGPGPAPSASGPPMGAPPMPPPLPSGPFRSPADARGMIPAAFGPAFATAITTENLREVTPGVWQWKYDVAGTASGFAAAQADLRRWPRWRSIACPTLVVRGARSPALPQAAAEQMVQANSHAELVVIPDAGHFVALDQPVAFERAVRTWLRV